VPSRTIAPIAVSLAGLFITTSVGILRAAESARPEIGLFLRFDAPPGEVFLATMEAELARIMRPADLRLRWLLPGDLNEKRAFARALVFTFHGVCRATPGEANGEQITGSVSLADTAGDGASILPYSDINCDRLRGFLSGEGPAGAGAESRLGFAMARVLAHEMYHVLLETRVHGRTGISRARHTPSALLSRSLRFNDDELTRMRARLRPAQTQTAQNISFRPN
jgi:hypothetical protein